MSAPTQEQLAFPWLERWLRERRAMPGPDPDQNLYEAGWIDSFDFVCLLDEVEKEFSVRLEFQELLGPSAKSLRGLAGLIEEKRAARA